MNLIAGLRIQRPTVIRYTKALMTHQLIINGQPRRVEATTVRELVVALGLGEQAVAVEVNRQVVPKRLHDDTPLSDGDAVELVTLVGGG